MGGRTQGRGSPAHEPDRALVDFLLDLGLSAHVRSFVRAEILTMDDLKLMTDADMAEVGLPKGPRLRIIDAMKRIHGGTIRSDGRGGRRNERDDVQDLPGHARAERAEALWALAHVLEVR